MFTKIMTVSLAVGALAFNAPAAMAATQGGCGLESVQNDTVTGQSYEGVAYGYAIDDTGAAVSVRCYITVNGVEAAGASISGSGTGVAVASGPVSFEATRDDDVELCTSINGGPGDCADVSNTQIPPQEVIDLLADILVLLCLPVGPAGQPGLVEVAPGGELRVLGSAIWDCPPSP